MKRNKLAMKSVGGDPIGIPIVWWNVNVEKNWSSKKLISNIWDFLLISIPIFWRNVKLLTLKKHWFCKYLIDNLRDLLSNEMLCLLLLFTHVTPYLVIAMHLPCLSLKQKSIASFIACFDLSSGMFSLLIIASTAIFWLAWRFYRKKKESVW